MTLPLPCPRSSALAGALAVAVALAGCGGSSDSKPSRSKTSTASASKRQPALKAPGQATPIKAAPPLRLRNSLGRTVDLRQFKGKAVFVTFIYTHCPDTCPLIVANLRNALIQLGSRASQLQLVAVSTDPKGDTPTSVKRFLAAHDVTGRMHYLLGNRRQLGRVWKDWGIVAKPDTAKPDQVEHSALIYGIGASGKLIALYPSNFKPRWVAHDAPLLAAR